MTRVLHLDHNSSYHITRDIEVTFTLGPIFSFILLCINIFGAQLARETHRACILVLILDSNLSNQARARYGFMGARNPPFFAQNAGFCFLF